MKFIDLFGGIGGFSLGMERSGHECAGYYEWDKYCVQIYNRNFRTNYKPTDITKLDAKEIPDFGCLCAGFPCQPFSIAGKRQGFQDIRGTLFAEIVRIAEAKRPGLLFLENVKGLLNHDNGETFATILHSLSELGYALEWEVLNSKNFGVPQNRERVFIIGHLGEGCPRAVFPVGQGSKDIIQVGKNKEGQEDVAWSLRGRVFKYGIELAIDLAFAKGENYGFDKAYDNALKQYCRQFPCKKHPSVNVFICRECRNKELAEAEQRGYEKGYDEGYTDGINNGTYRLKKPTAKKEVEK